jgi:hypothetical protein
MRLFSLYESKKRLMDGDRSGESETGAGSRFDLNFFIWIASSSPFEKVVDLTKNENE